MKLIINIPEDIYKNKNYVDYFGCSSLTLADVIEKGTPISDNATNGNVIKAMFDVKKIDMSNTYCVHFPEEEDYSHYFFKEWWNSPYQKGGKVE